MPSRFAIIVEALEVTEEYPAKTMACRKLGGSCDQKLSASSWDEMVRTLTNHVIDSHSQAAKEMERMYDNDPKAWGRPMKPRWDAKAETVP